MVCYSRSLKQRSTGRALWFSLLGMKLGGSVTWKFLQEEVGQLGDFNHCTFKW